jgi:hypothetical protein
LDPKLLGGAGSFNEYYTQAVQSARVSPKKSLSPNAAAEKSAESAYNVEQDLIKAADKDSGKASSQAPQPVQPD